MADYDSSLPIRTETAGDVDVQLVGLTSSNIAEVNSSNEQLVKDTDVATALGGNLTVVATDLDIRDLDYTLDNVEIKDAGGDALAINSDGSINVTLASSAGGDDIHQYGTTVAGVPNTPNTVVSYTVTAGKTLLLKSIQASASGKFKVELKAGTPASETTRAVAFGSTAEGSVQLEFPTPIEVSASDNVLVIVTNRDKANADLYAFINGTEV